MSLSQASVLNNIASRVKERVEERKNQRPLHELKSEAQICQKKCISLKDALLSSFQPFSIIAEIKRASPSQGEIAMNIDPISVAEQYIKAGASALSVLTEMDFFHGKLAYLEEIKSYHPDMCVLQKDFIIDEYQVWEAYLKGADAILLIMSLLGGELSRQLYDLATRLSLSVLVEVHNQKELAMALELDCDVIGINSRNLHDFSVDHDIITALASQIPDSKVVVAESGINAHSDLVFLRKHGCRAFLVGTKLMKQGEPGKALRALIDG